MVSSYQRQPLTATTLTNFDRRAAGEVEATEAHLWDVITTRTVVLSPSTTVLGAVVIKVVVVEEAQEEAMVDVTAILRPEMVVVIQPRLQIGCHLLREPRALVVVCHRRRHLLISAMAVDTGDTGVGTTRATGMVEDTVRPPASTTVVVEAEAEEAEVIKAIKVRGINNRRIMVAMTVDKEVTEGIGDTIAATVATVVATVARTEYMFKALYMFFKKKLM